jgi:TRAP-type C4-dicarboxylate transport system substrate-binding protein
MTLKTLLLFSAVIFFFICFLSQGNAAEESVTLKLTNQLAPAHFISVTLDEWAKELEKRTNGRVKVKNFHGCILAPANQQYDAAVSGIADVCNHVLGNTTGRFPLSEVLDLPLGCPDSVTATRMANEYYEKFKPEEFNDLKALWLHSQAQCYVCMKDKPVTKLEDLKGLKIRTFGGTVKFMTALGGTPVAMPMPEVYEALSRGIVDGMMSSYEVLETRRIGEHIRHVTENKLSSYSSTFVVAMNKRKWESLPADLQKIIEEVSSEYAEKSGMAWDQSYISGKKFAEKQGAKCVPLSQEEDLRWIEKGAKPVFEDYVQKMKGKGLPGEETLKFALEYLQSYKKQ